MSKYYGSGLIGLDVKRRRKVSWAQRNRYTRSYSRWLLPVILALTALGLVLAASTR